MRYLLVILLLGMLLHCGFAQRWNPKEAILPASLAFASGAAWGMHETCVHHPDRLPASWNKQWWDARVSWTNKGTSLWGSTYGAFGKDAKHTFGTLHRWTGFAAGVTVGIGAKRPWWHYALDAAVSSAAFSIGFHTVYTVVFRP